MLTKGEFRSLIRGYMSDADSARWQDSILDVAISTTLDELWGELLKAAPYARSTVEIVTPIAPGYIDLRTVAEGGHLQERFHMLQKLTRDEYEYGYADPTQVVMQNGSEIVAPVNTYTFFGSALYMFPLSTSDVEIRYNFRPVPFTALAENASLDWPDGHTQAAVFSTVGRLLLKGGDGNAFLALGNESMRELKAELKKRYPGPETMILVDDARSWGSDT